MNTSDSRTPAGEAHWPDLVRLWHFTAPARGPMALAFSCSGLIGLLMLTPSIYMLQVYDRVLASGNMLTLLAVSLIALVSLAAVAWLELIRADALLQASGRLDVGYREATLRVAFMASLDPGAQEVANRALPDLARVRQFLCGQGLIAWFELPWVPLYLAVLYLLHPWLAGFAAVVVIVQAGLTWLGQRLQGGLQAQATEAMHRELVLARGAIRAAECVTVMGMLPALRNHWRARRDAWDLAAAEAGGRADVAAGAGRYVRQLQQSLMLGLSAWLVVRGELTAGSMIASTMLCARALGPIDGLLSQWGGATTTRDALRRLDALCRQVADVGAPGTVASAEAATSAPARATAAGVVLRGLSAFAPPRAASRAPILSGIDMELRPGGITALVGPSGSGKSTLARVLVGAWPATRGEVLLDGRPLQEVLAAAGGAGVGYLPQEPQLFDGSVAANIARLQAADPAAVIQAAQAVGAHEAILRLAQGYDTPVTDPRLPLNAGLLQRIGLARAVYGQPRLLVLDEPDAHLDEEGERLLRELLLRMRTAGCVTLVVSHRPGLLRVADRVAVLDGGRLRVQGPATQVGSQIGLHAPIPL